MSDTNTAPIVTELTNDAGSPVVINLGELVLPLVSVHVPARERKTASGTKAVKEKFFIRTAPFNVQSAVAFFATIVTLADQANAGDGAKLAEKVLGRHVIGAFEDALVVRPNGETEFDENQYAKSLIAVRKTKSGQTAEDLKEAHTLILTQAVALSDLREAWRYEAEKCETDRATGQPINHPWTAEVWAEKSAALSNDPTLGFGVVRFDGFAALTNFILNLRDRRVAIEREMKDREERRRVAAENRKAKKSKTESPAA